MSPCQHFMKNDPKREEVTALIDLAPLNLFRRHVRDRSEDLTGKTEMSIVAAVGAW